MDLNRSFKVNVKMKCANAIRSFMKIKRIRQILTKDACETLVLRLVISHLDYSTVWWSTPRTEEHMTTHYQH